MTSASTKRPSVATLQRRAVAAKDAEIQRLRAAMVHAMDDCEMLLWHPNLPGSARTFAVAAHVGLKTALEKK